MSICSVISLGNVAVAEQIETGITYRFYLLIQH